MFCLRCGTEIKDEGSDVYCAACLADMERDPIPQGTAIHLPTRTVAPPPKRPSRKKELKPEEQLARLRTANRWLFLGLVVALIAFLLTAFLLLRTLDAQQDAPLGRNFRTVQQDVF